MLLGRSALAYLKELSFFKLAQISLGLFIFCFPFQTRSLIYAEWPYISGNFNEFSSFFIYFNDVFLILSVVFWGFSILFQKRHFDLGNIIFTSLLGIFILLLAVSINFSDYKWLSVLILFRFLELFLFYLLLINDVLKINFLIKIFLFSMFFQCLIAIFQYFKQGSLGLRLLGESIIDVNTLGAAKVNFGNIKLLRAYGTFPHPNVLASGLFMAIILGIYNFKQLSIKKRKKAFLAGVLMLIALTFTFSRTVFVALLVGLIIYFFNYRKTIFLKYFAAIVFSMVLIVSLFNLQNVFIHRILFGNNEQSVVERFLYLDISKNMMISNFYGVGLGGFTLQMQNYTDQKLAPWLYQPVHNVFFLVSNEVGILAGFLFLGLFVYLFIALIKVLKTFLKEKQKEYGIALVILLVGIFIISMMDHYFFTIYQGQFLLFFYFGLVSNFLKKFGYPRRKS